MQHVVRFIVVVMKLKLLGWRTGDQSAWESRGGNMLWQRMCLWVLVVTYSFLLVPTWWMVVSMISA